AFPASRPRLPALAPHSPLRTDHSLQETGREAPDPPHSPSFTLRDGCERLIPQARRPPRDGEWNEHELSSRAHPEKRLIASGECHADPGKWIILRSPIPFPRGSTSRPPGNRQQGGASPDGRRVLLAIEVLWPGERGRFP